MTDHVVCRECRFEALSGNSDEADRIRDTHEAETGHNVVSESIEESERSDGRLWVTRGHNWGAQ